MKNSRIYAVRQNSFLASELTTASSKTLWPPHPPPLFQPHTSIELEPNAPSSDILPPHLIMICQLWESLEQQPNAASSDTSPPHLIMIYQAFKLLQPTLHLWDTVPILLLIYLLWTSLETAPWHEPGLLVSQAGWSTHQRQQAMGN